MQDEGTVASGHAEPASAALEIRDLTRRLGDFIAVDRVSLTIAAGETFGLIGSNGAGKSTLIKMLTTLLPPTSGSATVAGFDIVGQPAQVRAHIGYVPQLLSADGSLTGYENLLLSARLYGIPRRLRTERIAHALTLMELTEVSGRLVHSYSGGMIRRLEIAQSLLHRPAVMFMDEPTVGLDPTARLAVWDHVRRVQAEIRTTILVTTHYMEEADHYCDRIALMHRGRIVDVGTPAALKAKLGADASLDDVFTHLTGTAFESGGSYHDVQITRRSARGQR
jgi:ABC-2 type transport system ATP-binding protein